MKPGIAMPYLFIMLVACETKTTDTTGLNDASNEFSENTIIYSDGDEVVIETNGHPNHTSPYWPSDHELYVAPTVTTAEAMAPGDIDNFNGSYTLRVPITPEKASSSSATGLGAIGIAVSGSVIYNDEEGPNVPLDSAVLPWITPVPTPVRRAITTILSPRRGQTTMVAYWHHLRRFLSLWAERARHR